MVLRTDSAAPWQSRTDRGQLLRHHVRPDGTLLVEGFAAREGVLEYRQADGSVVREFVSAQVLADSAATLGRAAVTLQHPDEARYPDWVTPETVKDLGVGDVDGEVVIEADGFVRVKLAVRRDDAIAAVQAGTQELSCGYRAIVDQTPGEHPVHGRYDAVQVARLNNHLAIVDVARAGHEARIRVDGVGLTPLRRADAARSTPVNQGLLPILILLGISRRFDSDDAALSAISDALRARKDAEEEAAAAAEEEKSTLETALDAATTALATVRDELAAMKTEKEVEADKADRASLAPLCDRLKVDAAKHPKTRDLRTALAKALRGDALTRTDDAYVDAIVDQARDDGAERSDGREAGRKAFTPTMTTTRNPTQPAASGSMYQAAIRRSDAARSGGDK